jgi:Skp family chaperone for outer membrane proteins
MKKRIIFILLALILCVSITLHAGEVYFWKKADGTVCISDTKPKEGEKSVSEVTSISTGENKRNPYSGNLNPGETSNDIRARVANEIDQARERATEREDAKDIQMRAIEQEAKTRKMEAETAERIEKEKTKRAKEIARMTRGHGGMVPAINPQTGRMDMVIIP